MAADSTTIKGAAVSSSATQKSWVPPISSSWASPTINLAAAVGSSAGTSEGTAQQSPTSASHPGPAQVVRRTYSPSAERQRDLHDVSDNPRNRVGRNGLSPRPLEHGSNYLVVIIIGRGRLDNGHREPRALSRGF
ncbi:hypothetical protein Nepgr_007141 [Nepenthes gracilis]|uniref:Uncharacterized protein n=1 Tax=Nepenthes gracilis TaxID=150966 RepID=A0AAD3S739_NEPGR|nr:hypothetical protein Nepgr_007141 [Nepenthes gracilis]